MDRENECRTHIYVDADACPVVGIVEKLAEKYGVPVTLLCDTNHVLVYGTPSGKKGKTVC